MQKINPVKKWCVKLRSHIVVRATHAFSLPDVRYFYDNKWITIFYQISKWLDMRQQV